MPLRKLWNSICGTPSYSVHSPKESKAVDKPRTNDDLPAAKKNSKQAKPTQPKSSLLDVFSRGSEAAICRLVKRSGAKSVLEIGVGDGKRAISVATSLLESNPDETVRYAAIDVFEMGGGQITLREFNQQLREHNVQPTLIPMPVLPGLARVSSTLGFIDLVLIAEPTESIASETLKAALRRLTSQDSAVYQLVDEKWTKINVHDVVDMTSRAA